MKHILIVPIAIGAVWLGGCASTPKHVASLEQARSEVQTLQQDPLVTQAASSELAAARKSLGRGRRRVPARQSRCRRSTTTPISRLNRRRPVKRVSRKCARKNRLRKAKRNAIACCWSAHARSGHRNRNREAGTAERTSRPRRSAGRAARTRRPASEEDRSRHGRHAQRRAVRHRRRNAEARRRSRARPCRRLHAEESRHETHRGRAYRQRRIGNIQRRPCRSGALTR